VGESVRGIDVDRDRDEPVTAHDASHVRDRERREHHFVARSQRERAEQQVEARSHRVRGDELVPDRRSERGRCAARAPSPRALSEGEGEVFDADVDAVPGVQHAAHV
jgi:hypothetical protein